MDSPGSATATTLRILAAAAILSLLAVFVWDGSRSHKHKKVHPSGHTVSQVIIKGFQPNRSGDLDQLIYSADGEAMTVHFPPHTAAAITSLIRINDTVTIDAENTGRGKKPAELISIKKGNNFLRMKDLAPPHPAAGTDTLIRLKSYRLVKDEKNNISAIVTDEYFIPLPPHLLKDFSEKPDSIEVKGAVRSSREGFVNMSGLKLLRPVSVIINNTNFIL